MGLPGKQWNEKFARRREFAKQLGANNLRESCGDPARNALAIAARRLTFTAIQEVSVCRFPIRFWAKPGHEWARGVCRVVKSSSLRRPLARRGHLFPAPRSLQRRPENGRAAQIAAGCSPAHDRRDSASTAGRRAGAIATRGEIAGITSKLDYLRNLGITTLWVGPMFKQRAHLNTFHGYAIQDFLEVDSRFGTREDLVGLMDAAHGKDMHVILDIVFNHSGSNWLYDNGQRQPRFDPSPVYKRATG